MIQRRLQIEILNALKRSPAVALMGPRQVGKTTLAYTVTESLPSVYLDLENPLDQEKVRDIVAFHEANRTKLIILDEVQRLPEIFAPIRGIIDKERRRGNKVGQFLFLGSASMDLLQQASESLAGRVAYLELHPIDMLEYGREQKKTPSHLWLRGGFPESLLAPTDQSSFFWRQDFIRTYLERDIPQLGPRIPAETLRRFWTMLAHHQGGIFNAAQIARGLEVSGMTVGRYLDLMVDLLLVRRLSSWTGNIGKRVVRSPKVFLRDSGITHALLQIPTVNDLLGHPVVGGSWEGFVIENLMAVAGSQAQPYFYRTVGGAEIDLVLEWSRTQRWAIEIKRSSAPSLSKGFHIACQDIKPSKTFVVYAGEDTFPMKGGIPAISLSDLMHEIANA
ncbi:MAG: ATP-binding protein [Nitrospirota bacterium]|nr:ATP-binding protein [Nitrospirota bacterium]